MWLFLSFRMYFAVFFYDDSSNLFNQYIFLNTVMWTVVLTVFCWQCILSFPRLEKKNMLTELFVRYVLKSIICLLFADFPELLVFAFINVVDITVGYLAITSFFSNVRLVNCWMFKFRIPKTSGKKELSNIVMIVFQLSFM